MLGFYAKFSSFRISETETQYSFRRGGRCKVLEKLMDFFEMAASIILENLGMLNSNGYLNYICIPRNML